MYKFLFISIFLLNIHPIFAQSFSGKVVDQKGLPIQNVEVNIVEDDKYAQSDANGNWKIEAINSETKTLVFYKENYTYEQLVNQLPDSGLELILRDAIPSAAAIREQEYILDGCESVYIPDEPSWNVGFKISELKGDLAPDNNYTRRDPSAVIEVDGLHYVWYSYSLTFDTNKMAPWDLNDIYYATSEDGWHWEEKGPAVKRGEAGNFDHRSVFTTEIFAHKGKYYLVYQAAADENGIYNRNTVGMSVADSAEGPWTKLEEPILHPTYTNNLFFDNNAVHDPCLVYYNDKFYLYYKGECNCMENEGCERWCNPICGLNKQVKWGVAIADNPTGPYIKSQHNPVTNTGHEVMVWPYKDGIAILQHQDGPEANSIQFATDGVNFEPMGKVSNIPEAAGLFRSPKSDINPHEGIQWGLGHKLMWNAGPKGWMYIYRFDIVDNEPTGLNIIPEKIQIGVGQYRNLSLKLQPFEATEASLSWFSVNEKIASVDGSNIRGESIGTTTVYVKNSDGSLIDSCLIVVQAETFVDNTITVSANSFESTGGTLNDASSGGPGFGVKKSALGINFVNRNDWCTYKIDVPLAGVYELSYLISSPAENPGISLEIGNVRVAQDEVYTNGAWDSYYILNSGNTIRFNEAGYHTLKIVASGSDNWQWNLKSLSFLRLYETDLNVNIYRNLLADKVKIYTNPLLNQLYIHGLLKEFNVSLYSLLGQKYYSSNHSGDVTIKLDEKLTGTFLVTVIQNKQTFTTKVFL